MASPDLRSPSHTKTVRKKKTRELPNLSDCHACKRRTNSTNPSDRLRILNSQWRIVLLCKSCYNLIESSKLCSYCLTDLPAAAEEDSGADKTGSVHQCRKCHREMHRSCVSRYSGLAPFSFLPTVTDLGGREFSICIDCWMPKSLDNKLRGAGSKGKEKAGSDSCSPGVSRVSDCHEKPKPADEVVNGADCVAQKKVLIAESAKDNAAMEAEVSRRGVELDNSAFDLVKLDKRGEQDEKSSDACDLVDCYDKRLALQLHRAMNSSPRIARGLLLSSKSCTKSDMELEVNDDTSAGKLSRSDHSLNVLESQTLMETSSIKSMKDYSSAGNNLNALESEALMETSSIKSRNVGCEGNSVNAESQSCDKSVVVVCGLMQNGRHRVECDRFFRKYSRRASSNS